MAKTSSNVMISDFKEWLKGNGNLTPNSANSYISYLGVSYNNDLSLVSTDSVYSRSLKTIFKHKYLQELQCKGTKTCRYLQIIYSILYYESEEYQAFKGGLFID